MDSHIDELEKTQLPMEADLMQTIPDCYKYMFELNQALYKKQSEDR